MKNFSKFFLWCLLPSSLALVPQTAIAQGYYYPPPPGYYYPQYPQQQPQHPDRRPQQRRAKPSQENPDRRSPRPQESAAPRKTSKPARDLSVDTPPEAEISNTTGPLTSYTWDFSDTLADLGKATGLSPNQILKLNNLALSQLRDGQVLKIPQISSDAANGLDIKISPQAQLAREVWRGVRGKKRVALTYDAGGVTEGLDILLKNLIELRVPATFFVTGKFGNDHSDLVKEITDAGFPIHNHSWSHPEFTSLDDNAIARELSRTDDVLSSITGSSTKPYWRPPFGDRDDRVLKVAAAEGYRSIYWTLDTLDSVEDKKETDFVVNRVLSPSKAKANPDHYLDGAIILMHVGETGTANAVPGIVNGLRERGFTLVTLEEILQP